MQNSHDYDFEIDDSLNKNQSTELYMFELRRLNKELSNANINHLPQEDTISSNKTESLTIKFMSELNFKKDANSNLFKTPTQVKKELS